MVSLLVLAVAGLVAFPPAGLAAAPPAEFLERLDSARAALHDGRVDVALEKLEQANAQALPGSDPSTVAAVDILLGLLFENTADAQRALIAYEAALAALAGKAGTGDKTLQAALAELQQMPKGYRGSGASPVSVGLYRAELPALRQMWERADAARRLAFTASVNAGNLYLLQSQFAQADLLYGQALKLTGRDDQRDRSRVHTNLAWSALKRGDLSGSQAHIQAAVHAAGADPADALRRVLLAAAVGAREHGDVKTAISSLEQAVGLYRAAGQRREEARAMAHLGSAYLAARRNEPAIRSYGKALALNSAVKDSETEWHARGGLARARHRSGDLTGALAEYRAYMAVVERVGEGFRTDQGRVSFLEDQSAFLDDYLRAAIALSRKKRDFSIARQVAERIRERVLRDLVTARPRPDGLKPGELHPRDVFAARTVTAYPDRPQIQMAPAVEIRTYGEVPQRDEVSSEYNSPPHTADDHELAPPRATLLEYFVLPDQTLALVKTPSGRIDGAVLSPGASRLEKLIEEYRRTIDVENGRGVMLSLASATPPGIAAAQAVNAGERLYRELIEPVEAYLPGDETGLLVIVPHRSLWLLPFAALPAPRGSHFGDHHLVSYSPAESVWRHAAGKSRPDYRSSPVWVIGNPRMPSSLTACGTDFEFQQLPGAEDEAKAVAGAFGAGRAELFQGAQADLLRLRAWHPALGVLHLATHGVACSGDPLDSFLVLSALAPGDVKLDPAAGTLAVSADPRRAVSLRRFHPDPKEAAPPVSDTGILTAGTVAREFRLDADLVTLSACQTGLGKVLGQGNIGFTRAFLAAGARSVLSSLWRVDDAATRDLMLSFYREYLRHGNKALALQRAMRTTRGDFPAPRYWAAFTLVGAAE